MVVAVGRVARDGSGKQNTGGHLAGAGGPGKTEFPKAWTFEDVQEAIRQVVDKGNTVDSQGKPTNQPRLDINHMKTEVWSWRYIDTATVKGVPVELDLYVYEDGTVRNTYPTTGSPNGSGRTDVAGHVHGECGRCACFVNTALIGQRPGQHGSADDSATFVAVGRIKRSSRKALGLFGLPQAAECKSKHASKIGFIEVAQPGVAHHFTAQRAEHAAIALRRAVTTGQDHDAAAAELLAAATALTTLYDHPNRTPPSPSRSQRSQTRPRIRQRHRLHQRPNRTVDPPTLHGDPATASRNTSRKTWLGKAPLGNGGHSRSTRTPCACNEAPTTTSPAPGEYWPDPPTIRSRWAPCAAPVRARSGRPARPN
jgi:hypothetical protein